ncbi:MAG: sensor histidine kinase [Wujia sp.]
MKVSTYLWNKKISIAITIFLVLATYLMGYAFKVDRQYLHAFAGLLIVGEIVRLVPDYLQRRNFYGHALQVLDQLDEKYLIAELLEAPGFAEGEILCEILYETDKSMKERINLLEKSVREFREYLELWVHQVKVPLSALQLMNYNASDDLPAQKKELDKLTQYVEQILFYSRADIPHKDYILRGCKLEEIINRTIKAQRSLLLGNHIRIQKENVDYAVITDSKWLEFIIGQIVNNAIKYLTIPGQKNSETPCITFSVEDTKDVITLCIRDNGIGIMKKDLDRVFDKSFTGENGHLTAASTGMGLYICQKLCHKLGHKIEIVSEYGAYTQVRISFGKNNYYKMEA